MDAETIEELPVNSVQEVLTLQAGVSGFEVRGGSTDETTFMVDGIELKEPRTNRPITGLPLSAVQELSVQTGGFGAQYHSARSGVVNVVTKEGDPHSYGGSFSIKYSPPADKHFGMSPYDPDFYYLRPFLDDAVAWSGTTTGEPFTDSNGDGYWDEGEDFVDYNGDGERTYWDKYERRQYEEFIGWNAISENLLLSPTEEDLTPAAAQKLFTWQYRKNGLVVHPDRHIDFGFGGPVPFISESLGNLRFYLSHRHEQLAYLYPVSRSKATGSKTMLKLTSDLSRSMKFTVSGMLGTLYATSESRGGGVDYFSAPWEQASALNTAGFTVPWRLYTWDYWAPTHTNDAMVSAKFTHLISNSAFYEVVLMRLTKAWDTGPGIARDPDELTELFPGYFVDEAPVGFSGDPNTSIDGNINMGGAVSTSRDSSSTSSTTLKADFTSQVNERNEVQAGLKLVWDQIRLDHGAINYFLPEGNYWSEINRNPYRFIAYIQDKLEFEGFIASIGLNFEYYAANGEWVGITDVYDKSYYGNAYSEDVEAAVEKDKIKPKVYLNPRLSVSHPISINSKLYFNYGHYRQVIHAEELFRSYRKAILGADREIAALGQINEIGDPNLPFARTISYELGYDHSIRNTYLFHMAAYYKDISDQHNTVEYSNMIQDLTYDRLAANNYEDIRGFEVDLTKRTGDWLTGFVNYEYRVNTSGYFDLREVHENPAAAREYLLKRPTQEKPLPRPRAKSVIDLHTPDYFGPKIGTDHILGDWRINLISRWTAGRWFTYNPNRIPGVEYNLRYKPTTSVNAKFSKTFTVGETRIKFFADVNNVFNIKTFSTYGFHDGFDRDFYFQSLLIPDKKREEMGLAIFPRLKKNDTPGDVRPDDVDFVPFEWITDTQLLSSPEERPIYYDAATDTYKSWHHSSGWRDVSDSELDQIVEDKAHIDNPNYGSFVFLNPRDVFFGIDISFDF